MGELVAHGEGHEYSPAERTARASRQTLQKQRDPDGIAIEVSHFTLVVAFGAGALATAHHVEDIAVVRGVLAVDVHLDSYLLDH